VAEAGYLGSPPSLAELRTEIERERARWAPSTPEPSHQLELPNVGAATAPGSGSNPSELSLRALASFSTVRTLGQWDDLLRRVDQLARQLLADGHDIELR
jgi:hypothetical protein